MNLRQTLLFTCILLLMCSCVTPVLKPVEWKLQKEGILLRLNADSNLHNESGKEKPLTLILFQLRSPVSFTALSKDKKGIKTLQKWKRTHPEIASLRTFKVSPGSEALFRLDRAEGASHVGIVAGYDTLEKKAVTRLFPVPVFIKKDNLFASTGRLIPAPLEINVNLGPDSILKRMGAARSVAKKETENR